MRLFISLAVLAFVVSARWPFQPKEYHKQVATCMATQGEDRVEINLRSHQLKIGSEGSYLPNPW